MTQVEQLVRQRLGLDADTIGPSLVQRMVRLRMKALGLKKLEDYVRQLGTSRSEWNVLTETLVVTETWFFRDEHPFASMVRLVLEEWLPRHPAMPLRALSVPCSSGEEPYSIVMALRDAGLGLERLRVDAVDVSFVALARARLGVYGQNSFRSHDLAFRDKYFRQTKEGYVLSPAIRRAVNFQRGNLLEQNFPAKGNYDIIFCRNLLIYFDAAAQKKALTTIAGLLTPSGVLFVGAAEQPLAIAFGFVSARIPLAFACRKADGAPGLAPGREPRLAKLSQPLFLPPPVSDQAPGFAAASSTSGRTSTPSPAPEADERKLSSALEPARRLADAGRLKEAAEICENYLRTQGPSAQAFYLLGLIRDATGDAAALDYYRKALYLEPNHYEALVQMALWAKKRGDTARARTFQLRAQRISSSPKPR